VTSLAASAAHTSQGPGGLFLLAWGLVASALGLALITNFRGFADNFSREAHSSSAGLQKLPPWKWQRPQTAAERTRLVRLLAIPFAILGPILTIVGIISLSHKGIGNTGPSPSPSPFRYVFIVFAVASVAWSWLSPHGMFRPEDRHRGWRLAVALLSSLGALIFGIGAAMGQFAIALIALLVGGLPAVLLLMDGKPTRPGPDGGT
jgi:hypothetical protein